MKVNKQPHLSTCQNCLEHKVKPSLISSQNLKDMTNYTKKELRALAVTNRSGFNKFSHSVDVRIEGVLYSFFKPMGNVGTFVVSSALDTNEKCIDRYTETKNEFIDTVHTYTGKVISELNG